MRPPSLMLIAVASGAILGAADAGPNADGVVILHTVESVIYTDDQDSYCGQSSLTQCEDADTRTDNIGESIVVFALAAFPPQSNPRLLQMSFGVAYDESSIVVINYGNCGDYEGSTTPGWPGSGEGTALGWDEVQTAHLVEFYWFAAYADVGDPTVFALAAHPTQGAFFLDDGPVGILDPIADFGQLGFGTDGYLPCPHGPVPVRFESWGGVKSTYR